MGSPRVGHEQARQQLCQRSLRWLRQRRPRRRAGQACGNNCQSEFELTGWVVGSTTTTFHGDLREIREMLSPMLPAPTHRASSRPRKSSIQRRERAVRRHRMRLHAHRAAARSIKHPKETLPNGVRASPLAGCIAPRQSPHAPLAHERERCARPTDAKSRRPRPRHRLPYRVSSGE